MRTGMIGTSRKENEKRVAIHPKHISQIAPELRRQLFFEQGYGLPFGVPDEKLTAWTGNEPLSRDTLLETCDAVILPKPVLQDFQQMREGMTVWGWIHSVQQQEVTQTAINKKMTLVAFENMNYRGKRGQVHIFQKNNEMAGYCGVQHALSLRGIDGHYGPSLKAVVLSFGSVSRGAILALKGHGIRDITVLTRRPRHLIGSQAPGVRYMRFYSDLEKRLFVEDEAGRAVPMLSILTGADILVNGILQSPVLPVTFVGEKDIPAFERECLIIDISCDQGMGFPFAHPTGFQQPLFQVGRLLYYAVDHTPSLLWDSASWEISASMLPYLGDFLMHRDNPVLDDAVDMRDGVIVNREILAYQHRAPDYPHHITRRAAVRPARRMGAIPNHILSSNAVMPWRDQ